MKTNLLTAMLLLGIPAFAAADDAAPFRFTVTADSRGERSEFRHVLGQIRRQVGDEGSFHVSVGDIDPPAETHRDLVRAFGDGIRWFPVVGNHDLEHPSHLEWLRDFGGRLSLPTRARADEAGTTTYSFDHGGAHFVILDQYADPGGPGVDAALYRWLDEDLAQARGPTFVFGHLPAFPRGAHVGKALDRDPAGRDRFWALLERHGVVAYVTAHTHYYSRHRPAGSRLWQIDAGNAGRMRGCEPMTFLDVAVAADAVTFRAWQGRPGRDFAARDSWTVPLDAAGTPPPSEGATTAALTVAPVPADCPACRAGPAEATGAALVLLPALLFRLLIRRPHRA